MQIWLIHRALLMYYIQIFIKDFVISAESGSKSGFNQKKAETKDLSQNLISGTTTTFSGSKPEQDLRFIDPSKLRVFTSDYTDSTSFKENDNAEYDLYKYDYSYYYQIKEKAKCIKFMYGDEEIWRYGFDKSYGYPRKIYFSKYNNSVCVVFNLSFLISYKIKDHKWYPVFSGKPKGLELDISIRATKYQFDFSIDKAKQTCTYTARRNYAFSSIIKSKGQSKFCLSNTIWQAEYTHEYSSKVVVRGIGSSEKDLKLYLLNGQTKHLHREKKQYNSAKCRYEYEPWLDITSERDSTFSSKNPNSSSFEELNFSGRLKEVKVLTQDPSDSSETKENDDTQYTVKVDEDLVEYEFGYKTKCVKILYDGEEVWKYGDTCSKEQPKSFYVNLAAKTVIVFLKDDFLNIYKLVQNQWDSFFTGKPYPIEFDINYKRNDHYIDYFFDRYSKTFTYSSKGNYVFSVLKDLNTVIWRSQDKTEYSTKIVARAFDPYYINLTIHTLSGLTKILVKHKNYPWIDYNGKIPIELNIKTKKSTNEFEYYDYFKDVVSYTPRTNYLFSSVKQSSTVIYRSQFKRQYAYKVVVIGVGSKTKFLTLNLFDGQTKTFFKDENNPWAEYKGRIPVELDINTKHSTILFSYYRNKFTKSGKYIVRPDYVFSSVIKSKSSFDFRESDKIIWQTNDKSDYCYEVVLTGVFHRTKHVTIHLLNNQTKSFFEDKDNQWIQYEDKIPIQLDIKSRETTSKFSCLNYGTSIIYIPEEKFYFNSVKQSESLIWQTNDKYEYANNVLVKGFGSKTKFVSIHSINGQTKKFFKDKNNPWSDCKDKISVTLDIKTKEDKNEFRYYHHYSTNTSTYIAKAKYAFDLVKQFHIPIWQAKNKSEYSYKVVIKGVGSKNKLVKVHLIEGPTKVFCKNENKLWTEIIDHGKPVQTQSFSSTSLQPQVTPIIEHEGLRPQPKPPPKPDEPPESVLSPQVCVKQPLQTDTITPYSSRPPTVDSESESLYSFTDDGTQEALASFLIQYGQITTPLFQSSQPQEIFLPEQDTTVLSALPTLRYDSDDDCEFDDDGSTFYFTSILNHPQSSQFSPPSAPVFHQTTPFPLVTPHFPKASPAGPTEVWEIHEEVDDDKLFF